MRIGNWELNDEGIDWVGTNGRSIFIPLNHIGTAGYNTRSTVFDDLVHYASKTWMERIDMWALNSLYCYAISLHNIQVSTQISWVTTITMQDAELAANGK